MKETDQNAAAIGIIGGADGPTSVFVAGKKVKMPLRFRISRLIRKHKRKAAEKKIVANAHTLKELTSYAKITYGATELDKKACNFPANSHIYKIEKNNNCLEIEIDHEKDTFGASFSGSKKEVTLFHKIIKDLYIYYGVTEDDIKNKTPRYLSLLGVLSM